MLEVSGDFVFSLQPWQFDLYPPHFIWPIESNISSSSSSPPHSTASEASGRLATGSGVDGGNSQEQNNYMGKAFSHKVWIRQT